MNAVYHMLQSQSISPIYDRKRKVTSNENKLKRSKADCADIVDEVFHDVISNLDESLNEDFVCDSMSDIFE